MRLSIHEMRPDENHGRARRSPEQDQASDITIDLVTRQKRPEQIADKQPAEQSHGEGLHEPVHAHGRRDAAPMHADFAKRCRIDFEQHRDDHDPDKCCDRQIDLGHGGGSDRMEQGRHEVAQHNAGDDA